MTNPISGKILVLELWAQILLANQTAGLLKMFNFGTYINIEVFYKLILSFWVYTARHAQSTQNKMFAYLCNISVGDKVDFLPADKHKSFLHVESITLGVRSQACQNYQIDIVRKLFFGTSFICCF